jgi:hypothetical protein
MSTFILQWNEGIHTKTMVSVKSSHLLLLFYQISIFIYAFLPVLQNLKDAHAVEDCSSSSQPASHCFLDCVNLTVVTSQVIFQGPEQVVVWVGQIRTVWWMGEQFTAILCFSVTKWGTQWEQIFQYPRIFIISWTCAFLWLLSFILSDELIDFFLVALSCSSSWLTTVQLIGNVHVSFLKMFHPPFHTAGIPIYTTKLLVDDSCWVSFFHKKFSDSTLTKQHICHSHSCWRGKMLLTLIMIFLSNSP